MIIFYKNTYNPFPNKLSIKAKPSIINFTSNSAGNNTIETILH